MDLTNLSAQGFNKHFMSFPHFHSQSRKLIYCSFHCCFSKGFSFDLDLYSDLCEQGRSQLRDFLPPLSSTGSYSEDESSGPEYHRKLKS